MVPRALNEGIALKFLALYLLIMPLALAQDFKIFDPKRDSAWLPVTYTLNGTFDVIQNPYWFSQKNIGDKYKELWHRVRSPHTSVEKDGGYKKLIEYEFFSSRVLPNIGLHFIGGAYDTLWMEEYFKYYGYPAPKLFAFLTTYIAHFGNEALETTSSEISSHDHIADLYFFDLAAFFAAGSPTVMNFFLNDLAMKAWHFNPVYDVDGENFFNAGLNYVFRPPSLSFAQKKIRPMIYLGMQNLAGLTYDYHQTKSFSVAMGMSLTNPLKQDGRFVTGIFHETAGELDASLFLNGSEDFRWRLNIYENVFKQYFERSWRLALVLGQAKGPAYAFGLSFNMPFGLGGIKNDRLY